MLEVNAQDIKEGSELAVLLKSDCKPRIEVSEAVPASCNPLVSPDPAVRSDGAAQQQDTLDKHMRPGPGYAGSPMPMNLQANMSTTQTGGAKRGSYRETLPQPPVTQATSNAEKAGGKKQKAARRSAKPAAAAAAAAAKPAKKQKQVAATAGKEGVEVDLSRFKAATAATIKQYTGAAVRIPGDFFPGFDVPAAGYWLAKVGAFADENKTVWLHIPEEPAFWCTADELATLMINH